MGYRRVAAVLMASVVALISAPLSGAAPVPGINEKAVDGAFAFTVDSVITDWEVDEIPAQGMYLWVVMLVENVGRTSQTYSAEYQRLVDSAAREFSPNISAIRLSLMLNGPGPIAINPGNAVNVSLLFDVPKNTQASQYVLVLHASARSPGVAVALG